MAVLRSSYRNKALAVGFESPIIQGGLSLAIISCDYGYVYGKNDIFLLLKDVLHHLSPINVSKQFFGKKFELYS